jgi:hypothetical protein
MPKKGMDYPLKKNGKRLPKGTFANQHKWILCKGKGKPQYELEAYKQRKIMENLKGLKMEKTKTTEKKGKSPRNDSKHIKAKGLKMLKNDVLIVNFVTSKRDVSANRYQAFENVFIIRKGQRLHVPVRCSGLVSSPEQNVKQLLREVFNLEVRWLSDFQNVVVNHWEVSKNEFSVISDRQPDTFKLY